MRALAIDHEVFDHLGSELALPDLILAGLVSRGRGGER
jgi:hypothetical protein